MIFEKFVHRNNLLKSTTYDCITSFLLHNSKEWCINCFCLVIRRRLDMTTTKESCFINCLIEKFYILRKLKVIHSNRVNCAFCCVGCRVVELSLSPRSSALFALHFCNVFKLLCLDIPSPANKGIRFCLAQEQKCSKVHSSQLFFCKNFKAR